MADFQAATEPEAVQVRVNFTTSDEDLQLPDIKRQLLVPADIKRYGLSRILNSESMLDTAAPIPFDFLVNGTFLRSTLEDYLKDNGLSHETTVTLQYVRSLLPPAYQASFEHDDWVGAVDVLSETAPAATRPGGSFVPGQERLLSASYDGLLRVWNASGQVIATSPSVAPNKYTASILAAKFIYPTRIASTGYDRTVRIWGYEESEDHFSGTLKPVLDLYGHKGLVNTLDVDITGRRILTASDDGSVALWTTSKNEAPAAPVVDQPNTKRRKVSSSAPQRGALSVMPLHSGPVKGAVFDRNDRTVAYSASMDHTVRTVDLTTSQVVGTMTTMHPLLSLCYLPGISSPLLAAGTSARHITLVDPRVSAATTSVMTLRGHRNLVMALAPSPDNNHSLVSGSNDGTCRIWDLRSVRPAKKDEGIGGVSEAVYVIDRESQRGRKKRGDGCKVFGVSWDKTWGIVSGGEDKRLQVNRGSGIIAP